MLAILAAVLVLMARFWGPGLHIWAGDRTLERLREKRRHLPAENLILRHPEPFLYGTVAADLISFKRFGGRRNSCHNWNMAERLAPFLTTPATRAFGLGYLCHLAADVTSHNIFVPYERVAELTPPFMGHAFLESLADAHISERCWERLKELRHRTNFARYDAIVDEAVGIKVLPLGGNRWIFTRLVLAAYRPMWRRAHGFWRHGQHLVELDLTLLHILRNQILEDMDSVISGRDYAILTTQDPSGLKALRDARLIRRRILEQYPPRDRALPEARRVARERFWNLQRPLFPPGLR